MSEQEFYAAIGRRIRDERERRGWTIYDVAAIADVTGACVSRWERGAQRMKAYHLHLLAREGLA